MAGIAWVLSSRRLDVALCKRWDVVRRSLSARRWQRWVDYLPNVLAQLAIGLLAAGLLYCWF